MPVIPYPDVDRALHQINRHQVERAPNRELLQVRSADGEIVVSEWVPPITPLSDWAQKLIDGLSSAARTAKRFEGLPGQRRPSDG